MLQNVTQQLVLFVSMGIGGIGLLIALFVYYFVKRQDQGDEKMRKIADLIRGGSLAFLKKEYFYLLIFILIVFGLLAYFISVKAGISFVAGALLSMIAGLVGINSATRANVRVAQAANTKGIVRALIIAFSGGAVVGLVVASLGLLGISLFYYMYFINGDFDSIKSIIGFALGASSIALFTRVGGGIYTKAADIGADSVGKLEAGLTEDDARNPAAIADNVGDNVGDIAGMGSDIFESYVGAIIAVIIIAASSVFYGDARFELMILPIVIAAIGLICSLFGIISMWVLKKIKPQSALRYSTFIAAGLFLIISYLIINYMKVGIYFSAGPFWAVFVGVISGILIGITTEYYTLSKPLKEVTQSSEYGSASNIISGIYVGMRSVVWPIIIIGITVLFAYYFADIYGVGIAALGMLATIGITMAIDAYGPIVDNAGGIAQMSGLGEETRKNTDLLDSVGNTTSAIGKGFATGSATLTALALVSAFSYVAGISSINVMNPSVVVGLLIGAMIPFLFASLAIKAVGKTAASMIKEVRRQFQENPDILKGTVEPDSVECINISTKASIKQMILPGLIAIIIPILIGKIMGAEPLGGFLIGAIVMGFLLAIFMTNVGSVWDNAKKLIEKGEHGGKGSPSHKAAVVGDAVGDPLKDTAGPAMNVLIKLMCIVALVIAVIL